MKNMLAIVLTSLALSNIAFAHVCTYVKQIKGFNSAPLFNKAIINGKPIDYLVFKSSCNLACLFKNFKQQQFQYGLSANNLSVFDQSSVATLTIDSIEKNIVSGYLTCSSNEKRAYLPIPVAVKQNKIILDLQTEDNKTISRSMTFSNYSQQEYISLMKLLSSKSIKTTSEVGFTNYQIRSTGINYLIKTTVLNRGGNFMLIIERSK